MALTDNKTLIKGWVEAFLAILVFLGINQVFGRYSAVILEVNPVVFSCAAFSSCAFVLLLIGGSGSLAKETMRSVDTWIYGTILMMSYIIGMVLFSYVTSTEGTMLQKISVFLSLIGSYFLLGRKPDRYQTIGSFIVTIGVIWVCLGIESEDRGIIYLVAFLYGFLQVIRIFAAELHRPHAKAVKTKQDPKARARVVGFVMFVVSMVFLILSFFVALAQSAQEEEILNGLPVLADFSHAPTVFAGMISGVLIVAPSRLLEFSSSSIIKAENFTAVTTLSFIATLFWEWISAPVTGLSIKTISTHDIFAGILITLGGLFIALTRKQSNKKEVWEDYLIYEPSNIEAVDDTRTILNETLEHLSSDIKKASKVLKIPQTVLQKILDDKEKVWALKPKFLSETSRRYRQKVALSDSLTGVINRSGFMTALKEATTMHDVLSVLFIDLDKFKPVNDTYGHEAGDFVLKETALRLQNLFIEKGIVTRLGGDEFCVALLGSDKQEAENHVKAIKESLTKAFVKDGQEIFISASIGIATYPIDGQDGEALLKHADETMYKEKRER